MFRVISLNANGIRAAARKGFFDWLASQDADVVCIQETKAQVHQLGDDCFSRRLSLLLRGRGKERLQRRCRSIRDTSRRRSFAATATRSSTPRAATSKCSSAASTSCRSTCRPAPPVTSARRPSFVASIRSRSSCTNCGAVAPKPSSAVTGTLRTRKSISRTGRPIRRTPALRPRNAPGWTRCSVSIAGWTPFGR